MDGSVKCETINAADIALIVSHILPAGIETFDLVDHVWVG